MSNGENTTPIPVLVLGGGISGITAAVETAEAGYQVVLVEKDAYLGGRVARMNQYFPKLCAPDCGLEINYRRIKNNPRIKVLTLAEMENVSGSDGNFEVVIKQNPGMVNNNCTSCGKCGDVCPVERPDDFNYGLGKTKAIYQSGPMPFPAKYVIDTKVCAGAGCAKCLAVCQYSAIDLTMKPKTLNLKCGAIITATGWTPYDAARLTNLGFGRYKNVITNVMMERLAATDGPTGGKILRPSDAKEVKSAAFVQCAGSRDENHLPYCSAVCCLGSLKQVTYIKERYPEAKVSVFYIDIRASGTLEDFYNRVKGYSGLSLIKGKVAKVEEDPNTGNLAVIADDVYAGKRIREEVEMVVLATGITPNVTNIPGVSMDNYGFVAASPIGIYTAGCSKRPGDVSTSVQSATGTALKAIQSIVRSGIYG